MKIIVVSLIFSIWTQTASALPYRSQRLAIAGPSPHSPAIADEISKAGGNFFDQAVGVTLGLAVTHPYFAALGGGGFAVVRKGNPGKPPTVSVLDFRETAPKGTDRDFYSDKATNASTDGGLASGIPGVTAGLFELHKKFGKIKWARVVGPALRLAEKGFPVSGEWADLTAAEFEHFNASGKKVFGRTVLDKSKPPVVRYEPLRAGDWLKQPKLAKALRQIQAKGAKGFYEGPVAKDIVTSVGLTGGSLKMEDLKEYIPVWREPLRRTWRGFDFYLMPLPSSGGFILAQAFELLDRLEARFGVKKPLSSQEAHLWGETLKLSFAARGLMADPMASTLQSDLDSKLLASERLDRLAKLVDDDRAIAVMNSKSPDLKEALSPPTAKEKEQTTHFSMADQDGNAIALTITLNGVYGSGVVTDAFGIALNDEMDDFNTRPGKPNQYGLIQGDANAIEPGKRPLSSMSPTIIDRGGEFFATLGAPGGPRIPSAVWQTAVRLISQDMNSEDAISAPRVHHQFLPDTLAHDRQRFSPDVLDRLRSFGHALSDGTIARVYVVKRTQEGLLEAAADPRGEAAAGGR